jgi:hypothetical protein
MKDDINRILKESSGSNLSEMALLNINNTADIISTRMLGFIKWQRENFAKFEYFSIEDLYTYWKQNQ